MTKINKNKLFTPILLVVLFVVLFFMLGGVAQAFDCNGTMTLSQFREADDTGLVVNRVYIQNEIAYAQIQNKTSCALPVTLESWKMYDTSLSSQKYFNSSSVTIAANSTRTISANLPPCMAQVDLYYGDARSTPVNDIDYVVAWVFYKNSGSGFANAYGDFCTNTPPPPPTPNALDGSCSVGPSNIDIGEYLNWTATASGGTGSYTYSWTGTDSLYGNSSYVSKPYFTAGTKTGSVVITSGTQSITRNCNASVNDEEEEYYYNDLNVSCYASPSYAQTGSRVNWYANVYGGDGDYDYDWSGTDGLDSSSRSPSKTYTTSGSKRANLTVRDGDGNRASATCYMNVNTVLAFSQTYQPVMADAVYLNQIPYTGVKDNLSLAIFIGLLSLFSVWVAYAVTSYQKNNA